MSTTKTIRRRAKRKPAVVSSEIVGCEFFTLIGVGKGTRIQYCGRTPAWKWTHFPMRPVAKHLVPSKTPETTYYCLAHGTGMRDEVGCAGNGTWERINRAASTPDMPTTYDQRKVLEWMESNG